MRKLLTYLGLLTSLLAIPNVAKADNWAYYLIGDINSWSTNDCQTSTYKFGDTSNSTDNITWYLDYTGAQLDPNADGTAYFKFYVNKNSQYYYYLYNNNGNNNTSVTIGGSTVDVVSNNGSGSFQVTGISQTTIYRIYLQTGTNNDREKGTVRIEAIGTNVYTSSVDLLGTINSWAEATNVLTADGSEWKLSLTKAQVEGALYNGDFYFSFIENMNTGTKYAAVPNTNQTSLTVNGAYNSDVYATTDINGDSKKDYYWKFTPTGANNYTIYFKNDNGTRSVKVADDLIVAKNVKLRTSADDAWGGKSYDEFDSRTGIYTWYINSLSQFVSGYHEFKLEQGGTWYGYNGTVAAGSESSWTSFSSADNNNAKATFTVNSKKYVKLRAKENGSNWDVQVIEENDAPHEYYWVSPQITNGEKWPSFKLVPSRNRYWGGSNVIGDGLISTKYYTFTIKDDDLVTWKTKSKIAANTAIQWYIVRDDDVVVYRPASDLSVNDSPDSYDNDHPGTGTHDSYVSYKNYWNGSSYAGATAYMTTSAPYNEGSWSFSKGSAKAHTFNLNAEKGHVLYNYTTNGHSDSGYRLAGNWTAGVEVTIAITDDQTKPMTAWYYKKGSEPSTNYVAEADSVVYKVSVDKPGAGWGGLYLLIHPNSESTNWNDNPKVLRPLITLNNNLDGRALHGALTTANSEQSLNPEAYDYYQGYTLSFNATTMTYRLEFHTPDATLSPGTEDGNVDFKNTASEDIAVILSKDDDIHSEAVEYAIGFGDDATFALDESTKYTDATFNLAYDGANNRIRYTSADGTSYTNTVAGNTIYVKVRGFDSSDNYGDIHTYQYTFHSKITFEPHGGLFINSAKIRISGGVAPYRYEIWHYNTKTENGETVIDYDTGTKQSEGTFSNTAYNASDDNHRISTPGFLKIIDANNDYVSFEEVGGGFDFTYSTSENYKRNTTGAAITTVDTSNAGAYPNGADYWQATPGDLTRLLSPTWLDSSTDNTHESYIGGQKLWNGETGTCVYLGPGVKIYQTVSGLAAGTYTVQALVSGGAVPIHLELNDNEVGKVLLTGEGTESVASINLFGRCEHLENMKESTSDRAWHKLEGSATVSEGGSLKIAIRAEGGACLADVVLLKDANTTTGFRTTASTSPTDATCLDYRRRQVSGQPSQRQNNAYSFFDRGKNQNAVVFANNKTVIAMDPANLAGDEQNTTLKTQDRRHPFNVVGSDENDSNIGTAKALYLTDAGYDPSDANCLPVRMGTSGDANYNSTAYRTHGYSFCPGLAFYAEDLIFDRNMSEVAVRKTTCMLPVSFTPAQLKTYYGSNLKVYKWASRSGNDLTFAQQSDATELNANEPYIFWGAEGSLDTRGESAGKTDGKFTIGAITSTDHNAAASHSGFPGTYAYKKITRYGDSSGTGTADVSQAAETRFVYSATKGVFSVVSANGTNVKPFRAYFVVPVTDAAASAPQLTLFFDDSIITGVDSVETTAPTSGDIYTIGGVLVARDGNMSRLPKGIYIMNGKKYVVK